MTGIKDMLMGISLMVAAITLRVTTNESVFLTLLITLIGVIFVWIGYKK